MKVNSSGEIPMRITAPPGRFEATNVTARLLILNSYGLPDFRLANLPAWAGDERFDVAGRAAGPASRDEISAMVRSMLEDRFQLRAHRETRELPTYALVPAAPDRRPGLALRTSSISTAPPPRSFEVQHAHHAEVAHRHRHDHGAAGGDAHRHRRPRHHGRDGPARRATTWSSRLRLRGLCPRGRPPSRRTATRRRSSPPCGSSSG